MHWKSTNSSNKPTKYFVEYKSILAKYTALKQLSSPEEKESRHLQNRKSS